MMTIVAAVMMARRKGRKGRSEGNNSRSSNDMKRT
jgi:hypothetical protein